MRPRSIVIGGLFLGFVFVAVAPLHAQNVTRGYVPRPCGLDMNRNGIRGEQADCEVCDASVSAGNIIAGSAIPGAQQIFIDCNAGSDVASCGSSGHPPCRTIEYAWNTIGNGGYEILCFSGTCTDHDWSIQNGGNPGVYTIPARGNQVRPFDYPREPKMLVGWDRDNDREFPPFDSDDTALLEGTGVANDFISGNLHPNLEFAHFRAQNYNDDDGVADNGIGGGFVDRVRDYSFFHDLELAGLSDGSCQDSRTSLFAFWATPDFVALENLNVTAHGGYFLRGGSLNANSPNGPIRMQNLTVEQRGINETNECGSGGGRGALMKVWGWYTGIEILDSIRRCDVDGWNGAVPQWGCNAGGIQDTTQDVDIINNEFIDNGAFGVTCADTAISVQRPVDDIVFDRNVFRNTRPVEQGHRRTSVGTVANIWSGARSLSISGDSITYCGNITISNNMFSWENPEWEGGISYTAAFSGGGVPGSLKIVNNTFYGPVINSGATYPGGGYIFLNGPNAGVENVVIQNNIMAGPSTPSCVNIEKALWSAGGSNVVISHNVYNAGCAWEWHGTETNDFAAWKSLSGDTDASRLCAPFFVNSAGGNFHLQAEDTCARDRGISLSGVPLKDFDFGIRPSGGAWDIGADEFGSTYSRILPPQNLRKAPEKLGVRP